jgi:hypothetical protein
MSFIQLPKEEIRISIPKLIQDNTTIVREAYMSNLIYDNDAQTVTVNWIVQHFSELPNGDKGEALGAIIPDYIRKTVANNETMCNITSGVPLDPNDDGTYEGDYTGQYDFFAYLGETQPIILNAMIRDFGARVANWIKI